MRVTTMWSSTVLVYATKLHYIHYVIIEHIQCQVTLCIKVTLEAGPVI